MILCISISIWACFGCSLWEALGTHWNHMNPFTICYTVYTTFWWALQSSRSHLCTPPPPPHLVDSGADKSSVHVNAASDVAPKIGWNLWDLLALRPAAQCKAPFWIVFLGSDLHWVCHPSVPFTSLWVRCHSSPIITVCSVYQKGLFTSAECPLWQYLNLRISGSLVRA